MKKGLKIAGISIVLAGTVITGVHFMTNKTVATNVGYQAVVSTYDANETEATSGYDGARVILNELGSSVAPTEKVTEQAPTVAVVLVDDASTEETPTETVTEEATTPTPTEAVTEATTVAPTEATTQAPTQAPTQATTAAPTEAATQATTAAPTEATTQAPTQAPTQATTAAPTQATTAAPTEAATKAPEAAPATSNQEVKFTDVVFKDGVNTYNFSSLEEAKASLKVQTLSSKEAKAAAAANKSTYAEQIKQLVDLINKYRTSNGLKKVTLDDNLTNAAGERAAESAYANWNMTAKEGDAKRHIRPNFKKASTIGAEYGISGNFGENYARYFGDAASTLDGWKGSAAHNAVLTSSKYSKVGIGIAADADGYLYWIAIFN